MAKMKIYCVTNVELKYLEQLNLNLAGVGNKKFKKNIFQVYQAKTYNLKREIIQN